METKFYEFNQNNSGGHFDVDDNVCHRVIIEAKDEHHALELFEPMIEYQSGSCPCCGERWYLSADEVKLDEWKEKGYPVGVYSHYDKPEERWFKLYGELPRIGEPEWGKTYSSREFKGKVYFDTIEQYSQFMANAYGWTKPDVRIHRLDGTKTDIFTVNVDEK